MPISNRAKKTISALSLFIMLTICFNIIGYALEPSSYALYFNHDLEEIEKTESRVDLAFVGASRVYRSFVPEVFEEKLGFQNVVNAGSSSQPIEASYYQTKELIDRFHPKEIVLGVTWDELLVTDDSNIQGGLIVYDRLHGLNKWKFALSYFVPSDWLYLLDAYRFRENLDLQDPLKYISEKEEIVQRDYECPEDGNEYYADTGFVYSYRTYIQGNIEKKVEEKIFRKSQMDEKKVQYLNKIVKLCKDNDVRLQLVSGITSMMRIYESAGYQDAVDFYNNYAEENGIVYYNLNYLKGREEIFPDSVMHDDNHLNGKGAEKLSEIYAEILKKDMHGEETNSYFYNDLKELKKDTKRIVAVKADIQRNQDNCIVEMESTHNKNINPEYQVEISLDNGKTYKIISSWSKDDKVSIELPEKGTIYVMVKARTGDTDEQVAFQTYSI